MVKLAFPRICLYDGPIKMSRPIGKRLGELPRGEVEFRYRADRETVAVPLDGVVPFMKNRCV